jgi:type II secretory pathway predicted ATPase ExeA
VDDRDVTRPLADDPEFLDSLLELDRGLDDRPPRRPEQRRAAPLPTNPAPPIGRRDLRPAGPLAPPTHSESGQLLPPSITAPFESLTTPGLPGETGSEHGRRPLLDLFPSEDVQPGRSAVRTPVRRGSARPTPERIPTAPPVRETDEHLEVPPAPRPAAPTAHRHESLYADVDRQPAPAFALSTDPRFFYHSTPHDEASQRLLTAIRNREGLVVFTGVFGAGKTTLCRTVIEQLDRRTLTSLITDPFVSGEELLKQILADFGVLSRDELARGALATPHELSTTLQAFVESLAPLEASAVVIVDEAQNLPPDVFDQVKLLCEAADASALLQVVLVGQPALNERLRQPENKALHARVAVRCTLESLPQEEIADYIAHRVGIAGTDTAIRFEEPAIARIFALTLGIPRMVNLLCERTLARAREASATAIAAALVDGAARDLDLSPTRTARPAVTRLAGLTLLVVLFVLIGAAAAAWVFRDAVGRAVERWRAPSVMHGTPPR